jgi:hypothetical protein
MKVDERRLASHLFGYGWAQLGRHLDKHQHHHPSLFDPLCKYLLKIRAFL